MGWTVIEHREAGESHAEFFAREILGPEQEILASAHVGGIGGTFYAAVRERQGGEVWALVVLTSGRSGSRFGWKELEESQGPPGLGCPATVLDLLSPTDDERALAWRARAREHRARVEAVAPGAEVRFAVEFLTPEGPCREFVAVDPARDRFRGPRETAYRITSWRREPFELLGTDAPGRSAEGDGGGASARDRKES